LKWKLVAEVNYLEQVVAHRAARLTVSEVAFQVDLFPQLESTVNVFR